MDAILKQENPGSVFYQVNAMTLDRRINDRRTGSLYQPGKSNVLLLEVIESSLRITRREQFFSWLQSSCQYVFPHDVLLCGIKSGKESDFRFEIFSSTRYVKELHLQLATAPGGILNRAIAAWNVERKPVFIAEGLSEGNNESFVVPFVAEKGELDAIELKNIAAHGLGSADGGYSTFFCFARTSCKLDANRAYLLEFLTPHLHAVMVRLNSESLMPVQEISTTPVKMISEREREILQWVHHGKTNWEIASILEISPLTVKNHVQNILRKLNVQNRSHAAVKASRLGLVQL